MKLSDLTNKSHQGVYRRGVMARREGMPRTPPYAGNYPSKPHMVRAWLMGYDAKPKKASST